MKESMKENNAVVSEKTKETKKTTEKKIYKLGDEVKVKGKDCKIVEVLEDAKFHLKNMNEPFDSFFALEGEFE